MPRRGSPGAQPRPGAKAHARARAAALAAALVLACAQPGLTSRYRESERSWRESATPVADEDPLFPGASQLEREALVREVLRRNPSIRAARHAWKATLERYPQQTSLDDPVLGYGVAPRSFGSSLVDDAHRVDLSQHFPFPGKRSLRGEVALAEAEAAENDFAAVRLRLATMASLLFDELYLAERSLEINAEHLALLEEFGRIASARYEAGEASQQDPLQAEVEHAELLHRALEFATARRAAHERLNALLHRAPDLPLPPPPARLELPPFAEPDRDALAAEALRERPELRAAGLRVAGQESAVALARREFLPDFTLVGAWDGFWQEHDLQPFVGLEVNVPLRIARRRAAVEEARAELGRAESEREGLEDEVRFAVASGANRLTEAWHAVHLYQSRLLPAARDQVAAARSAFETGRSSFLDLIEAERSLRSARLEYEALQTEVSRRHAELESAIGRLPGLNQRGKR